MAESNILAEIYANSEVLLQGSQRQKKYRANFFNPLTVIVPFLFLPLLLNCLPGWMWPGEFRKAFTAGSKILHIGRRYLAGHTPSTCSISLSQDRCGCCSLVFTWIYLYETCLDTARNMFIAGKRCRPGPLIFTLWACLLREIHHSALNKADRQVVTDRHTVWLGNEDGSTNPCFLLLLDHHHVHRIPMNHRIDIIDQRMCCMLKDP